MADGPTPSLSGLLHELAEGLQSTGTYLSAARRISSHAATMHLEHASIADIISKAADELMRAHTAFHRLRDHLSKQSSQHGGSSAGGAEHAVNLVGAQSILSSSDDTKEP
jgi:hypothetical protein